MPDYCELADVYPLISRLGTLSDGVTADPEADPPVVGVPATVPTETQAKALITQVSAEINGHLRAFGYALPVSDDDAEALLKAITMNGAAARILKSALPAASGASGDGGAYVSARDDYQAGLALIDRGGLAADTTSDGAASTIGHGMPSWTPPLSLSDYGLD